MDFKKVFLFVVLAGATAIALASKAMAAETDDLLRAACVWSETQ